MIFVIRPIPATIYISPLFDKVHLIHRFRSY